MYRQPSESSMCHQERLLTSLYYPSLSTMYHEPSLSTINRHASECTLYRQQSLSTMYHIPCLFTMSDFHAYLLCTIIRPYLQCIITTPNYVIHPNLLCTINNPYTRFTMPIPIYYVPWTIIIYYVPWTNVILRHHHWKNSRTCVVSRIISKNYTAHLQTMNYDHFCGTTSQNFSKFLYVVKHKKVSLQKNLKVQNNPFFCVFYLFSNAHYSKQNWYFSIQRPPKSWFIGLVFFKN